MSLELLSAGLIYIGLNVFLLLGGADLGAGFLYLCTNSSQRKRQAPVILRAINPVWIPNHIGLFVALLLLLSIFPEAICVIMIALFTPIALLTVAFLIRGSTLPFLLASFTSERLKRISWLLFSLSSFLIPFISGTLVAALSTGQIRYISGNIITTPDPIWLSPFAISLGLLAVSLSSYIAAVYLVLETKDMQTKDEFRKRALFALASLIVITPFVFILARTEAPKLLQSITRAVWSLPLLSAAMFFGMVNAWGIISHRLQIARAAAIIVTSLIFWGWILAQYPSLLKPDLTIINSAAPASVMVPVLVIIISGLLLLTPALYYLIVLFKGRSVTVKVP